MSDTLHGEGPCALCGHDPACGVARAGENWLCHTEDHSCYHGWTVYGARPPDTGHAPPWDRRHLPAAEGWHGEDPDAHPTIP